MNNTEPEAPVPEDGAEKPTSIDRRQALQALGVATAALAVGDASAESFPVATATAVPLDLNRGRLQALMADADGKAQYLAMVEQVAQAMTHDKTYASAMLACVNNVELLNLYNKNRVEIEAVIGKLDGRTSLGRYKKILHASEFFRGVNSLDGVNLVTGTEEQALYASSSSSSSSGSVCGSCVPTVNWFLGCCIIHDWDWTAGMSGCSPCSTPQQTLPEQPLPLALHL